MNITITKCTNAVVEMKMKIGVPMLLTLTGYEHVLSNRMSFFPQNCGASIPLEVLFPESFVETRACKGLIRGNFFEEQNALEIILGCFLDVCFVWAGEALLELCSEGARLTQWSKILL